MLNAACPDPRYIDNDLATLLHWVYYHDILAGFSFRHWRDDGPGTEIGAPILDDVISHFLPIGPKVCNKSHSASLC